MCDCSCEMPACSDSVMRKARKQHKCYECQRPIEPGERYEYYSGIWDGEPESYKTCRHCKIARDFHMHGGCFCFGELRSELRERARHRRYAK